MKVAFLFGAGVSIPAKLPSTKCLTDQIFSGKGIVRGMAENYFFGEPQKFDYDPYQEFIPRIRTFLNLLKNELHEYYNDSKESVNYEDTYYLLDFIRKNIYGAEKNPAFKYLLKNFESTLNKLSAPIDPLINEKISLETLLNETIIYIKDSVILSLLKKPESYVGLSLLGEIISNNHFNTIDVFTLNHDLVIEEFLKSINKDFCEGFGKEVEGYRFWDQSLFELDNRINLYKLHGSVDWYYYDETSWEDRRICKCTSDIVWRDPRKPEILIGTYNKLAEYIKGIYLELFCRFYKTLNMHSYLIISGYSFSDKGINAKIIEWIYYGNKKMIIIDPLVNSLKEKVPSSLFRIWNDKNRINLIQNNIEKVSWNDINKIITN